MELWQRHTGWYMFSSTIWEGVGMENGDCLVILLDKKMCSGDPGSGRWGMTTNLLLLLWLCPKLSQKSVPYAAQWPFWAERWFTALSAVCDGSFMVHSTFQSLCEEVKGGVNHMPSQSCAVQAVVMSWTEPAGQCCDNLSFLSGRYNYSADNVDHHDRSKCLNASSVLHKGCGCVFMDQLPLCLPVSHRVCSSELSHHDWREKTTQKKGQGTTLCVLFPSETILEATE